MTTDPPTSTGNSSSIENDGGGGSTINDGSAAPRRYIYNQADMEHFRHSTSRKELLSFVTAMGRGLTTNNVSDNTNNDQLLPHGGYNSHKPLANLTPALAALHGSLTCISQTWMDANSDGIPPDLKVKARFGNPAFRTWHARLVERSYGIVRCLMDCHVKYSLPSVPDGNDDEDSNITGDISKVSKEQILKECYDQGYRAATNEGTTLWPHDHKQSADSSSKQEEIITELRAYLHDGFGHPIRIDYGTGHESSFIVFLLSLCKIGCFSWGGTSDNKGNTGENIKPNQSPQDISLGSLSIFHAYLNVTRGLQRDYMLEPAGSHGVWGLDDYHCVPFYLGACQMIAREQWQQQNQQSKKSKKGIANKGEPINQHGSALDSEDEAAKRMPDTPYLPETTSPVTDQTTPLVDTHKDNDDHWTPSVIHNKQIMETHRHTYLYLSCIHFIQEIKPNVPFFESSPMLNDISHIGNWTKVSSGLLRLYEGEVLDKMPVVQHFVFGKIFSANWTPSRTTPLVAPKSTFIHGMGGEECVAPWAVGDGAGRASPSAGGTHPSGMPPTRAPWAK